MSQENNWKQLNQYVDLYKFHWDLAIKLSIFILGISGAMAAYVIKNQNVPIIQYSLLLPLGMCIFGAVLAQRSLPGVQLMRDETIRLGDELQLDSHPEFRSLVSFVSTLRFLFALSAFGLMVLFVMLVWFS